MRTKACELKRNLLDVDSLCRELQNSAVQLDKAKAQAQLNHEQAEDLRRKKNDLEKQIAEMKQKAAEVNATHARQIGQQVLSVIKQLVV